MSEGIRGLVDAGMEPPRSQALFHAWETSFASRLPNYACPHLLEVKWVLSELTRCQPLGLHALAQGPRPPDLLVHNNEVLVAEASCVYVFEQLPDFC